MSQILGVAERTQREVPVAIVDSDVHTTLRPGEDLRDYLPEDWKRRNPPPQIFTLRVGNVYTTPGSITRTDATPEDGGAAGSDPDLLNRQLIREAGVDMAIMVPLAGHPMPNPVDEAAVCAAVNSWQAQTWLGAYNSEGRFRGSIRVCSTDPELAVQEIERWGGDPRFVQVMVTPNSMVPLGHPSLHPVYAAATRHGLTLATHITRASGTRLLTPVGNPSYYLEYHPIYSALYWTHVVSLVLEGVFEKFPEMRLVLVEGGFSWLAPIVWRMERHWREFRSHLPQVKRSPAEYVHDHIWCTTQPIEEPPQTEWLGRLIETLGAEDRLLFSTDYPHWDFDDPKWVLGRLPKAARARVMSRNAIELYSLPETLQVNGDA